MNEELQHKLVEIIGAIQSATGKASDFAISQLPDVAQSYVAYGRASATLLAVFSTALLSASIGALCWGVFSKQVEKYGSATDGRVFSIAAGVFSLLITVPIFLFATSGALLVWLSPKVWLIKELAGLIK